MKTILFILFFTVNILAQTTYYIAGDGSGNNSNAGTSQETAWEDLNAIYINRALFATGDIIRLKRGSTFDKVPTAHAGTYTMIYPPDNDGVLFKTYDSGAQPIIDGINGYNPIRWIGGFARDDMSFDSLTFYRPRGAASGAAVSHCIDIENCDNFTVTNSVFDGANYSPPSGRASCMVAISCNGAIIMNNEMKNISDEHGIYFGGGRINKISRNYVHAIATQGININNTPAGEQAEVFTITYNWVESTATSCTDSGNDSLLWAYNVLISKDSYTGTSEMLRLLQPSSGPANTNPTNGRFYNNTIIIKNGSGASIGARYYNEGVDSYDIKNNIFYSYNSGTTYWTFDSATPMDLATYDNNLYYSKNGTNEWQTDAGNYSTFATWQSGASKDANGLYGSPDFLGTGADSLSLQLGSPAIDAGVAVYDWGGNQITLDYNGGTVTGTPDMGAFEYGSSPPSGATILYLENSLYLINTDFLEN